jgi:hypothetical protein
MSTLAFKQIADFNFIFVTLADMQNRYVWYSIGALHKSVL